MADNHQRALFSNTGDGNWTGASAEATGTGAGPVSRYFPPGDSPGVAPTAAQQIGGSLDTIGWNSKTNWIVQAINASGAPGSGKVEIIGHRPTGISEQLVPVTTLAAGVSVTEGGVGGEEIYGPFSYFEFRVTDNGSTTAGPPATDGRLSFFVIGWNYGNIWEVQV